MLYNKSHLVIFVLNKSCMYYLHVCCLKQKVKSKIRVYNARTIFMWHYRNANSLKLNLMYKTYKQMYTKKLQNYKTNY